MRHSLVMPAAALPTFYFRARAELLLLFIFLHFCNTLSTKHESFCCKCCTDTEWTRGLCPERFKIQLNPLSSNTEWMCRRTWEVLGFVAPLIRLPLTQPVVMHVGSGNNVNYPSQGFPHTSSLWQMHEHHKHHHTDHMLSGLPRRKVLDIQRAPLHLRLALSTADIHNFCLIACYPDWYLGDKRSN